MPQRKPLAISEGQGRGAPAAWRPGSPWPLMMHTGCWLLMNLNHNFDHLHHSLGSSSSWSDLDLWKWMYPQTSMGALTLAASLKRVNTSRKLAIMVTSEGWLVIQYCHHHQWWFTIHQACHNGCMVTYSKKNNFALKINSIFSVFPCVGCTWGGFWPGYMPLTIHSFFLRI